MNPEKPRVVIDTNVIVSRILFPESLPAHVINLAQRICLPLVSESLIQEFLTVLKRPKFFKYIDEDEARQIAEAFTMAAKFVVVTSDISVCRDPKDNKLLALAIDGIADFIITGDEDLLMLNPFQGIVILTPKEFIMRMKMVE